MEQQTNGLKRSSINRGETALKAALNWGVHVGILEKSPLERLRPLKETDSEHIVRYLSDNERKRLYKELYKLPLNQLRYAVIVSLNTGVRRVALLSLTWDDISFKEDIITLKAAFSKSGKTQKIPMNAACIEALSQWKVIQKYPSSTEIIFPEDNHLNSWRTLLKRAAIKNFRWHDMRHDFASRLILKGVDLNTVRELLGHSDLKMTMRYAHLAPEAKKKAVDLLG